jgi:folate-binding protein YgfZ
MASLSSLPDQLAAIEAGHAWIELSSFRTTRVAGSEARGWLHDLVTTDVASLEPGQARRSLLLTPTGRIRADFSIGCIEGGFVLLQSEDQPDQIGRLLSPYVLSSAVVLEDGTDASRVVCVIAADDVPVTSDHGGEASIAPSVTGIGVDIVTARHPPDPRMRIALRELTEVGHDAIDTWRVRNGVPTMGRDFDRGSLPSEAGLDETIDAAKGCFLGQESVAKIRNFGHPPTALLHVYSEGQIPVGAAVFAEGDRRVGQVTSAAPEVEVGTIALARIAWDARSALLTDERGGRLLPVGKMD